MLYIVKGTDRTTNKEGAWEIDAPSEWEAAQKVEAMGVDVLNVSVIGPGAQAAADAEAPSEVQYRTPGAVTPADPSTLAMRSQARTIVMGLGIFFIARPLLDCFITMSTGLRVINPGPMMIATALYIAFGVTLWILSLPVKNGSKGATIAALVLMILVAIISLAAIAFVFMALLKGLIWFDGSGMGTILSVAIMTALSIMGVVRLIQLLARR